MDALVLVKVHALGPNAAVDLDEVADGVIEATRKASRRFELQERHRFATDQGAALSMRASLEENGKPIEGWWVIHDGAGELAVVIGLTSSKDAPGVLDELLQIGLSLELKEPASAPAPSDEAP